MFRQGQLAVHGLAILLGRNEAGISNWGKIFLHHAVDIRWAKSQGVQNGTGLPLPVSVTVNTVMSAPQSLIDERGTSPDTEVCVE